MHLEPSNANARRLSEPDIEGRVTMALSSAVAASPRLAACGKPSSSQSAPIVREEYVEGAAGAHPPLRFGRGRACRRELARRRHAAVGAPPNSPPASATGVSSGAQVSQSGIGQPLARRTGSPRRSNRSAAPVLLALQDGAAREESRRGRSAAADANAGRGGASRRLAHALRAAVSWWPIRRRAARSSPMSRRRYASIAPNARRRGPARSRATRRAR